MCFIFFSVLKKRWVIKKFGFKNYIERNRFNTSLCSILALYRLRKEVKHNALTKKK